MQSILFNLVGVSITISIVVALLLLLSSYFNERYAVKWRYFIWMILAIRLIIPLDFGFTAPPMELVFNDHEIAQTNALPEQGIDPVNGQAVNNANLLTGNTVGNADGYSFADDSEKTKTEAGKTLTVSQLATGIYLAGIAVFLLWQIGLYLSFHHATRRWCREPVNGQIRDVFESLKDEMGIVKTFRIRVCRKILSPMIAGLFRPTLMLPHEEYQKIDLEVILKHELVHIKRNDLWFKLLLIFANALHWFNPFIYVMAREANKDIEISCDEEVLKGADLTLRKRYSERILELMQGNHHQEAPVSTNFYGGKGMMKSRIRHIFDERVKKKGVLSFLIILFLVLVFSACRFDIGQNQWQIPISVSNAEAYGQDEEGNRNSGMSDLDINMPFDLDHNGSEETTFTLSVAEKGKTCFLKYKEKDGKTVMIRVFDGIEPGIDYSLHAANLEGTDSIMLMAAINYRGMPFGSGYWELYSWNGKEFKQVDIKPVEENLQIKILEPQEKELNTMKAGVKVFLFDINKYPKDYPFAGLYFKDDFSEGTNKTLNEIWYMSLSEYDVEGYHTWGQGAINKTMTEMNFVPGDKAEGWTDPTRALLETTEIVFVTLPNITATVKHYYQYQDGKWSSVDGMIS
jgi:beta-lactamase regulating signal transducer with metallopeptidase domain